MPTHPSKENSPIKQHYLPQCYLKYFMKNGELWVRDHKKKETRQQSPKSSAFIRLYYSFISRNGMDYSIEHALGVLEGDAAPILNDLEERKELNSDQKSTLSLFVSFLFTRVPDFQRSTEAFGKEFVEELHQRIYSSVKSIQEAKDEHERQTGKKLDVSAEQMYQDYQDGTIKMPLPRTLSLKAMLHNAFHLSGTLLQRNWAFMYCPANCSFVTTDNPFMVLQPTQGDKPIAAPYGIKTPGALKVVPLTQSCCLAIGNEGHSTSYKYITSKQTKFINRNLTSEATRFTFGRDKALLDSLARDEPTLRRSRWNPA